MITPIPGTTADSPAPEPHAASHRSQTGSPYRSPAAVALGVVLAIACGVVGAITVLLFSPDTPECRLAAIDMQQISRAVTQAFGQDATALDEFNHRFEAALRDLQTENPSRIILIKEAVLAGDVDDATPELLRLLKLKTPTPTSPPPTKTSLRAP